MAFLLKQYIRIFISDNPFDQRYPCLPCGSRQERSIFNYFS